MKNHEMCWSTHRLRPILEADALPGPGRISAGPAFILRPLFSSSILSAPLPALLAPCPALPQYAERIQAARNCRAVACPGEGQIRAAKTGSGFSVDGPVLKSIESERESFCAYRNNHKLPASLRRNRGSASRPCTSRRVLAARICPSPGQLERPLPPYIEFFRSIKEGREGVTSGG